MKIEFDRSVDIIRIWIDGKSRYTFDDDTFKTMVDLWNEGEK